MYMRRGFREWILIFIRGFINPLVIVPDVEHAFLLDQTLNTEQARAVFTIRDAVMSPAEKVFLLQGPPGTGKSHTIMALVHEILQVISLKIK